MKANHNEQGSGLIPNVAVSNGSKILKWKQITTKIGQWWVMWLLFPMVQRY